MPRVVDWPAIVRVGDAGRREGRGGSRRGVFGRSGSARTAGPRVVVESRIARLVEGDEMALDERVAAAGVELHVLTGLVRGADAEGIDAVLLHVGESGEIDFL